MTAIESRPGIASGVLSGRIANYASVIRMSSYPATSLKSLKTGLNKRRWAHTNFRVISLLFQDHSAGSKLYSARKYFFQRKQGDSLSHYKL